MINEKLEKYLTEINADITGYELSQMRNITEKHIKNMVKELKRKTQIEEYAGTDNWLKIEEEITYEMESTFREGF